MGLSAIPYFISKGIQNKENQTHNVKIVNFNENNKSKTMMLPDEDNGTNDSNDSGNNDSEGTKPEFPSNHYIYEGSVDYGDTTSKDSDSSSTSSESDNSSSSKKED